MRHAIDWRALDVIAFVVLASGCGNTSVALGGPTTSGSGGSAGTTAQAGNGNTSFGGYGDTGWAGQANTAGAPMIGAAGFGGSTAAEVCASYPPWPVVNAARLDSCAAVAAGYQYQDANLGISYAFADSTPGAKETHQLVTLAPDQCGDTSAWHLIASGQASFGGSYQFTEKTLDYSGWDGIALWVRAAQGTTATFALWVLDGISLGKTVIDPATGAKACYNNGDDWDLDGKPNLTPPPIGLQCQGWSVILSVDDQWHFVMVPWSQWTTTSAGVAKAGLDKSDIQQLQLGTLACRDVDLWLASVGAYRALPSP